MTRRAGIWPPRCFCGKAQAAWDRDVWGIGSTSVFCAEHQAQRTAMEREKRRAAARAAARVGYYAGSPNFVDSGVAR